MGFGNQPAISARSHQRQAVGATELRHVHKAVDNLVHNLMDIFVDKLWKMPVWMSKTA